VVGAAGVRTQGGVRQTGVGSRVHVRAEARQTGDERVRAAAILRNCRRVRSK
jgi:hypothetical protein